MENVDAKMHEIDYVPCYRSPAGTGTANGFYWWEFQEVMTDANEYVTRLRKVDCCAVSDALDSLKLTGVVTGLPQQSGDRSDRRTGHYGQARQRSAARRHAAPPLHDRHRKPAAPTILLWWNSAPASKPEAGAASFLSARRRARSPALLSKGRRAISIRQSRCSSRCSPAH